MAEPVVSLRGVSKSFKSRRALLRVELDVPAGSVFGLVGPNGAGKTTLMRCLVDLARPTEGTITMHGLAMPDRRREVLSKTGALIEEPKFHRFLSGRENLLATARLRGAASVARIPGLLERVGLADRAEDRVDTYSLGMRQRLAIARCLLGDPALLVLDEPANGLDPDGIRQTRELLAAFQAEGRTVLISSHQLGELEKVCDHVALIDAGVVKHVGPVGAAAAGGGATLDVACSDPTAALPLVEQLEQVRGARADAGRLLVELVDASDETRALVVRTLVTGGVDVHGAELRAGETLEELYMRVRGGGSS